MHSHVVIVGRGLKMTDDGVDDDTNSSRETSSRFSGAKARFGALRGAVSSTVVEWRQNSRRQRLSVVVGTFVLTMVLSASFDIEAEVMSGVATAILGGLIGFVALLFAVGALTYESGAYKGSRALNKLLDDSRWFSQWLSGGIVLALVASVRPNVISFSLTCALLATVLQATPHLVSDLVGRSSAKAMAQDSISAIRNILDSDGDVDDVKGFLNDLRASAIHMWRIGDIEGARLLMNSFLDSIPERPERGDDFADLVQFKYLEQWIRMQISDLSGVVFLADVIADRAEMSIDSGNVALAQEYLALVTRVVRRCVWEGESGELLQRSVVVGAKICSRVTTDKHDRPRTGIVEPTLKLARLDEFVDVIDGWLRRELGDGRIPTHISSDVVSAFLHARVMADLALLRLGSQGDRASWSRLAEVIVLARAEGVGLDDVALEAVGSVVYDDPNEVTTAFDRRVMLVAPMLDQVVSQAFHDTNRAMRTFRQTAERLVNTRIDGGSERYLYQCLREAESKLAESAVSILLRRSRLHLAVCRKKDGDVADDFLALIQLASRLQTSLKSNLPPITSALEFLAVEGNKNVVLAKRRGGANIGLLVDRLTSVSASLKDGEASETQFMKTLEHALAEVIAHSDDKARPVWRVVVVATAVLRLGGSGKLSKTKESLIQQTLTLLWKEVGAPEGARLNELELDELHDAVDATASMLHESQRIVASLNLQLWMIRRLQSFREEGKAGALSEKLETELCRSEAHFVHSFARLLGSKPDTEVTSSQVMTAIRGLENLRLPSYASVVDVASGLCHMGLWVVGRKPADGLPGFRLLNETLDAVERLNADVPGAGPIFVAARRSLALLQRKDDHVRTYGRELSDRLAVAETLAGKECLALVEAYALAAHIEARSGDHLDAARLLLRCLTRVSKAQFDRPEFEADVIRKVYSSLGEVLSTMDKFSEPLPGDPFAVVEKLSTCEENLRELMLSGLTSFEDSPALSEEILERVLRLQPDLPRPLSKFAPKVSDSDARRRALLAEISTLHSLGNHRHSVIYEQVRDFSKLSRSVTAPDEHPSPAPRPWVAPFASAALHVMEIRKNGSYDSLRPALMRFASPREGDFDSFGSLTASDRRRIVNAFDWIAEETSQLGSETRIRSTMNAVTVRQNLGVVDGLRQAWQRLLRELDEQVTTGDVPEWAVRNVLPLANWLDGTLLTGLVKWSASGEGQKNATEVIRQIAPTLREFTETMLSSTANREPSSALRNNLEQLRRWLSDDQAEVDDLLVELLQLWNPYYLASSGEHSEPWLPDVTTPVD